VIVPVWRSMLKSRFVNIPGRSGRGSLASVGS
jgi:hypothetical protein